MPINVTMPALSPTMTEGTLAKWLKVEGDSVESGDVIAEIETDKATMEVEAVDEGVIGKILISEGTENVAVNSVIAVLLEDGESASDIDVSAASNDTAPAPQAAEDASAPASSAPAAAQSEGKVIANRDILYAQGEIIEPPPFDEASFTAVSYTHLTLPTKA